MRSLRFKLWIVGAIAMVLVLVHIVNTQLGGALNQYGVVPRSVDKLHHVLLSPFIHCSYGHLFSNLLALVIFSSLCLLRSVRFFLTSSLFIFIVSGLLVWLFGRPASHIGASGWIFGLWSLSIAIAWFDRRFGNIALAILVIFFYGGMIFGIIPGNPGISFEMHLAGLVAGVLFAFIYASRISRS